MADTTNTVEGLHAVRRKFADKRINYGASYSCRANLGILATFLDNWQILVLAQLGIEATPKMKELFKVIILFVFDLIISKKRKQRTNRPRMQ
jgi:hypothetical protein